MTDKDIDRMHCIAVGMLVFATVLLIVNVASSVVVDSVAGHHSERSRWDHTGDPQYPCNPICQPRG